MGTRIQNLTLYLYIFFICGTNIISSYFRLGFIFQIYWMNILLFFISFLICLSIIFKRHKLIKELDRVLDFSPLYQREMILGAIILVSSFSFYCYIIYWTLGAYHLYWVFKNKSIFYIKTS